MLFTYALVVGSYRFKFWEEMVHTKHMGLLLCFPNLEACIKQKDFGKQFQSFSGFHFSLFQYDHHFRDGSGRKI